MHAASVAKIPHIRATPNVCQPTSSHALFECMHAMCQMPCLRLDLSEAPAALTYMDVNFPATYAEWHTGSKEAIIEALHWQGPASNCNHEPPPFVHPISVRPTSGRQSCSNLSAQHHADLGYHSLMA